MKKRYKVMGIILLFIFLGYVVPWVRYGNEYNNEILPWGIGMPWFTTIEIRDTSGQLVQDRLNIDITKQYPFMSWERQSFTEEDLLVTDGIIRIYDFGPQKISITIKNLNEVYEIFHRVKHMGTTVITVKRPRFPIFPRPEVSFGGDRLDPGEKWVFDENAYQYSAAASDTQKAGLLEFVHDGLGHGFLKNPRAYPTRISKEMAKLGYEDVYDLDGLDFSDSLFHPFDSLPMILDKKNRLYLVKAETKPPSIIAVQYSARAQRWRALGPDSLTKWISIWDYCSVRMEPDRRSCDYMTCHCQGDMISGYIDGKPIGN